MSEAEKAENRKRAAEWYRNNKERANAASRAAHKKRKQAARDAGTTWYQLNKSAMKEQYRTKYTTVEGRAGFIWRAAKSRARKHSVPFTLTKERVVELMLAGKCAI